MQLEDTIIALATPAGQGAIAVIRLSGKGAIALATPFFRSIHHKKLTEQKSHTIHLGQIIEKERSIDEVLVAVFKAPHSYTGENIVEISCHGSTYIQQEIIQLFLRNGCRMANPGEFTLRAFLNGKLDLSQAEAVADLIASDNEASHQIALQQMRGGFSNEIKTLRDELLNFASLLELELDFAEEDVAFADRKEFESLLLRIKTILKRLIDSFAVGNVLKNGIPVAIVGEPNVGKSTLLNALLNEERAIVSEIAGTTRDTIEDEIILNGIGFRFIDTAGIRKTQDVVENIGIQKTFEKITQAEVVLYLIDSTALLQKHDIAEKLQENLFKVKKEFPLKPLLLIANKTDQLNSKEQQQVKNQLIQLTASYKNTEVLLLAAKTKEKVTELQERLLDFVNTGALRNNETLVSNTRHYDALTKALKEINNVYNGLQDGLSGDLLAIDIRQSLYHFGEITGEITTDDLLGNIFANFCIGK